MWTEIGVPALFAGGVAIGATMAIERWGGKVGGVLGSMPTTIVPAALGIWASSPDEAAFAAAMCAVPAGMFVDALFLWTWRVLPGHLPGERLGVRLLAMTVLSLGVWFVAATGLVVSMDTLASAGIGPWGPGVLAFVMLVGFGLYAVADLAPSPPGRNRVPPGVLLARGVFAGTAIAVAIAIARSGQGLAAGVASVFPAIFLTTMASLWLSQGRAVPAGAVGPMMLGSTSVAAFALWSAALFGVLGPAMGAVVCWVLAVGGASVPAAWWLHRRPTPPPDRPGLTGS